MSQQHSFLGLIATPVIAIMALSSCVPIVSLPFNNVQSVYEFIIKVEKTPEVPKISERELAAIKEVLERRLKALNIFNPKVQAIGSSEILVQLRGIKDPESIVKVLVRKAELEFRQQKPDTEKELFTLQAIRTELTTKQQKLKNINDHGAVQKNEQDLATNNREIAKLFTSSNPPLNNRNIKDAYSESTQGTNWLVNIRFDEKGSQLFTTFTKELAGTGRSIGIFLDNELISSPVVGPEYAATGITGGSAVIQGKFTAQEAKDLAALLHGGALPLPVKITVMTQK